MMLIRCPECGFERELNPTQVPDTAVMATCPQCSCRFRFRGDGPPTSAKDPSRDMAHSAAGKAATASSGMRPAGDHKHTGDDPLPPGAIIPGSAPDKDIEKAESARKQKHEEWRHEPPQVDDYEPQPRPHDRRSLFSGSGPSEIPWEIAPPAALPIALYQTILGVLFAAPAFFTRVGYSMASLVRPFIFYVLIGTLQSAMERFWFLSKLTELAENDATLQASMSAISQSMSLPLLLVTMPPILVLQLMFYGGVFHLMIRLVQPDRANFMTTVRTVAYSAAPGIFCLIPVAGPLVASIWFAVCCFIGCKFSLGLAWSRTAMAILPLYVLFTAISLNAARAIVASLNAAM